MTGPSGSGQVAVDSYLMAKHKISGKPASPVTAQRAPADEVARLYRLGLTMAEIADIYGVSAWTVASRLDRAGVTRRCAKDRGGALPVDQAVRRYRS